MSGTDDVSISASEQQELFFAGSYTQLPDRQAVIPHRLKNTIKGFSLVLSVLLVLVFVSVFTGSGKPSPALVEKAKEGGGSSYVRPISRGKSYGVSEKTVPLSSVPAYDWTNDMLLWQRTSYHFQPEKNWMNDPNGPIFYKGWYHLFYQYNPDSAVWGNITWGHSVSRDLIHWLYLPISMVPDRWFDLNGVWTGSATLLADGSIIMLYTGSTNEAIQVQNLAVPSDPSDPLLLKWAKYENNPVLTPPPGIGIKDFRDPTTAWLGLDGAWRITIGSKVNKTGISLVYKTTDFKTYELVDGALHAVAGTGMWECVDFYPVSTTGSSGLDTSVNGPGVKHVLKASLDDDKHDYYALGTYDINSETWTPDNPEVDVGIGMRYDYGKFYASKTFYDTLKKRRILWGWIGETDSERTDLEKGWASVQSIPRTVVFDEKTGTNLIQWPVEELESLRTSRASFDDIKVGAGEVLPLEVGLATQLDISADFKIDKKAIESTLEADVAYNCSTSGGVEGRGALGPFGLLVLSDEDRSEQTAVYFYIAKGADGNLRTFFCQDELKSSMANDLVKRVYGSYVPVLDGEKLTVRILVDHSIVESFAQGGRTSITSRIYPTKAINSAARIFVFNNATATHVTATSIQVWQMNSAFIHPYSAA